MPSFSEIVQLIEHTNAWGSGKITPRNFAYSFTVGTYDMLLSPTWDQFFIIWTSQLLSLSGRHDAIDPVGGDGAHGLRAGATGAGRWPRLLQNGNDYSIK